jgi:AcrR family transcriptional regulator
MPRPARNPDRPKLKPRGIGAPKVRTPERERVVIAMVKANATHALIAEAVGIDRSTLYKHYRDLIPAEGPGRPEHAPTDTMRALVKQYRSAGLTHDEIAASINLERSALEKHYPVELLHGKAAIVAAIGNKMVVKALSNGPDAQRAGEFFLASQGAEFGWGRKTEVDLKNTGRASSAEPEDPLVSGPPRLTRDTARRVAFLLTKAANEQPRQAVVVEEEAPPASSR